MGRQKIYFDEFNKNALSRLILGFYKRNPPVLPTLDKICDEAMKMRDFPKCGKTFEGIGKL